MSDFPVAYGNLHPVNRLARYKWLLVAMIALVAILFQVYVPRLVGYLRFSEMPLLITIYFALAERSPAGGTLLGAAIGLAQDSLSAHLLGMFGIVKTLVGYFAGTMSLRFDVYTGTIRFLLVLFFFGVHQFFYWVLTQALLGQPMDFEPQQTAVRAVLNALVAIPLFSLLDRVFANSR